MKKDYNMPFKNAAIDKMSGKFGNGDPKPKAQRDNWGRPAGDKYYNFNPKTKRYEDQKDVYKYRKSGYGEVEYAEGGIGGQVSYINTARAKDSMEQQNAYYGRPLNSGMKQAQQDANKRASVTFGAFDFAPNYAPKKKK